MGKGQIISGGVAGQYQVRLMLNTARLSARIATLNEQIVHLDALILAGIPTSPPLSTEKTQAQINRLTLQKTALQLRVKILTAQIPAATANIVSAWCADLTENLTGEVGTIEVPGERGTVMIQPGYGGNAAYNAARDGQLQPGTSATPEGCFYNLALLPGWQKWKPTYRFGTISNLSGDVCTVTLENASSSQQNLNVNQGTVLNNVPITYMMNNGAAFVDGDAVVVKFTGQSFAAPVVIGFKHDPGGADPFDGSFELGLWRDAVWEYIEGGGLYHSIAGRTSSLPYDGLWCMDLTFFSDTQASAWFSPKFNWTLSSSLSLYYKAVESIGNIQVVVYKGDGNPAVDSTQILAVGYVPVTAGGWRQVTVADWYIPSLVPFNNARVQIAATDLGPDPMGKHVFVDKLVWT